jgi:tetratricopeptide (TPR) repeat protein
MNHTPILMLLAACWIASPLFAASRKQAVAPAPIITASTNFAPLPQGHELASIWNDPAFAKKLIGSYGFLSEAEPKLNAEEHQFYTNSVQPLLAQDQKKAIEVLQAKVKPQASAQFDYLLGTLYFQNEDLTNAVKCFENALAKFPDFRRAQKNLAFALVRDGKYAEAVKPLTRTIALGGADSKVFGLLGFAQMSQGRYASAEGAYKQALALEPDNIDFKLGCVKCAVASANYDYALALLDELLQQHPERDNLWALQANIYIQKDQTAKAAVSLELLRRLGKATPQNLFLLGDLYMTQEARDLALGAYLEAIDKDDGKNPAKALRPAQILVSRGAWDEARRLFAKIRGSGGTLSSADELKLLKLESKVAMSTGEGDKAIHTLEQIVEKNPLDGEALLLAGDFYARNGQKEKAEFRFDAAAKIEGFEADAFVKHAQLLVQSQKYAQAVELLRKAQKSKPRDNVQRYMEKVEQMARAGRS